MKKLLFIALVFNFICGLIYASELKITVAEILEKKQNAVDPAGAYRKSNSYVLKQRLHIPGVPEKNEYVLISKFKKPNKTKAITTLNGVPISVTCFDGERAWRIMPHKELEELKGPQLDFTKLQAKMSNPSSSIIDIFAKIDLGEEDLNGTLCYKLTCHPRNKKLHPIEMLIGKRDFLTKELRMKIETSQGLLDYRSETQSYTDVKGVKISKKIIVRKSLNGQAFPLDSNSLISFEWDVAMDDSEFNPLAPTQ